MIFLPKRGSHSGRQAGGSAMIMDRRQVRAATRAAYDCSCDSMKKTVEQCLGAG